MLAVVNFTRHLTHYLLGQKLTIITDYRALQWLHNFKHPDALTASWREKLAAFKYEVIHRPAKPIGHADGLSRTPLRAFNSIVTEDSSEKMHKADEKWPNRTNEWRSDSKRFNYSEIEGDILQSKDSIAHCVSADFQLSACTARGFKRRFLTKDPENETIVNETIWPQWFSESQGFVYYLITKARQFHKPTYKALRASFEALQSHTESNNVQRISSSQIGCGLAKMDWQKVQKLIHEVFQPMKIDLTVFLKPQSGTLNSSQIPMGSPIETDTAKAPDDSHNIPSLASDQQRNDPALKHLVHWITSGTPPSSQDLQGLPRTTWKLAL